MNDLGLKIKITADGQQGEAALKRVGQEMAKLSGEVKRMADNTGKMATDMTKKLGHYSVGIFGVTQAFQAMNGSVRDVVATTAKFDSISRTLQVVTGSSQAAAQQFSFLQKTANDLGIDLASAAGSYAKLSAAARGTALAGEDTDRIFSAVAKSSAALGLSAAETEGALLAIGQMMSKGTVSAEELRGQLGERLPGAFQAMAKAVGVSTAELSKMLEQGKVGIDVLPQFAAELERLSSRANLDGLQNNINRLGNEWDRLKLTIGDSAPINDGMTAAAEALKAFNDQADRIIAVTKVAGELLLLYFGGKALGAVSKFASKALESHAVTKALGEAAEQAAKKVGPFGEKVWRAEKATTEAAKKAGVMEFAIDKMGSVAKRVADNPLQALIAALLAANGAARAFSQESDDLITKINAINENIRLHREQGRIGSTISSYLGYDENKLLNRRDSLVKQLEKQAEANNRTATDAYNNDLVDRGIEDANRRLLEQQAKGAEAAKKSFDAAKAAADQLNSLYATTEQGLQKQIALHGDNSAAAEMGFEVQYGGLTKLNEAQKNRLLHLAAERDFVLKNIEAYKEYDDIIEQGMDLASKQRQESSAEFERLSQMFSGENQGMYKQFDDAFKAKGLGIIDDQELARSLENISQGLDAVTGKGKDATDQLSEYAVQAARNMQSAFADFLFDPFDKGLDGMLDGFLTTIRRMAANAASQNIMEGLFGKGSGFNGGLLGGLLGGGGGGGGFNGTGPLMSFQNSMSWGDVGKWFSGIGSSIGGFFGFADGGIMTSRGPLPLNTYAMGGIATSPQLALFGEGRTPEAFVPLPDGRRIPVKMDGAGGGKNIVQNVTINISTPNADSFRRSERQIRDQMMRALNV